MRVITPYRTAITLFGSDGSVRVFRSLKEALRTLGLPWIHERVGRNFREFSCTSNLGLKVFERHPVYNTHAYVMRDDWGDPVTGEHFADYKAKRCYRNGRWWRPPYSGVGPVPGIHRYFGGHYFRRPQTMQERRVARAVKEDFEPGPRGARNAANIPNAWDDIRNASWDEKNWKRFRKTRYHRIKSF